MDIELYVQAPVAAYKGISGRSPEDLAIGVDTPFYDQVNDLVIGHNFLLLSCVRDIRLRLIGKHLSTLA
jgi:hypothetical protein